MRLSGSLREEDFVAAQFVHLRPRRSFAAVGIILGIGAAVAAVASVRSWLALRPTASDLVFWMPWFWISVIVYFLGYFFWFVPFSARRVFREQKSAGSEIEAEVATTGITFTSQYGLGTLPWDHILRWREGREVFLLYISSVLFHVIPKRFFQSEAQVIEFRKLLSDHPTR